MQDDAVLEALVTMDLPYDLSTKIFRASHKGWWFRFLDASSFSPSSSFSAKIPSTSRAQILRNILSSKRCRYGVVLLLATLCDSGGRSALSITDAAALAVFEDFLYFCGRYNVKTVVQPIHISDASIILRATDRHAATEYASSFDLFSTLCSAAAATPSAATPSAAVVGGASGTAPPQSLSQSLFCMSLDTMGLHADMEDEAARLAVILDDVQRVGNALELVLGAATEATQGSKSATTLVAAQPRAGAGAGAGAGTGTARAGVGGASKGLLSKDTFVKLCCEALGENMSVAIKFMKSKVSKSAAFV